MNDTVQVFTLNESPACIACAFSVERLLDAIEANAFALCAAHMLRASVYLGALEGGRHLRPVER